MKLPYTSAQVAHRLGISRASLIVYISRHPALRPALALPSGNLLWTEDEVKRIAEAKAKGKPGRPAIPKGTKL